LTRGLGADRFLGLETRLLRAGCFLAGGFCSGGFCADRFLAGIFLRAGGLLPSLGARGLDGLPFAGGGGLPRTAARFGGVDPGSLLLPRSVVRHRKRPYRLVCNAMANLN
jgi:hypothetical protein